MFPKSTIDIAFTNLYSIMHELRFPKIYVEQVNRKYLFPLSFAGFCHILGRIPVSRLPSLGTQVK
jgi:hypothetical protein